MGTSWFPNRPADEPQGRARGAMARAGMETTWAPARAQVGRYAQIHRTLHGWLPAPPQGARSGRRAVCLRVEEVTGHGRVHAVPRSERMGRQWRLVRPQRAQVLPPPQSGRSRRRRVLGRAGFHGVQASWCESRGFLHAPMLGLGAFRCHHLPQASPLEHAGVGASGFAPACAGIWAPDLPDRARSVPTPAYLKYGTTRIGGTCDGLPSIVSCFRRTWDGFPPHRDLVAARWNQHPANRIKVASDGIKVPAHRIKVAADGIKVAADRIKVAAHRIKVAADGIKVRVRGSKNPVHSMAIHDVLGQQSGLLAQGWGWPHQGSRRLEQASGLVDAAWHRIAAVLGRRFMPSRPRHPADLGAPAARRSTHRGWAEVGVLAP